MVDPIPALPPRRPSAHKGESGDVLVVAGSRRLAGAAALAAEGAARAGAGFVRLAVPAGIADRLAGARPSRIVLAQRETRGGEFAVSALPEIIELAAAADAVVLGPGLGRSEDLRALVGTLLAEIAAPIVLDADGLHALATIGPEGLRARGRTLITPHPGEAALLLGSSAAEVQADREAAASALVGRFACTVVLKGAGSLVRAGKRRHRNETGNPGMATAGMGDVLAGMIGALLASGLGDFDAARIAVQAHGRAGDLAREDVGGERGLLPEDLAEFVPRALAEFER